MEDNTRYNRQYYLQDELGSPIRLTGEDGALHDRYGYDEFGQDLYGNQGKAQPFGYTGYQSDEIAGIYFAQAREFSATIGRFIGEDILRGYRSCPCTLNTYYYCYNNPMNFIDLDGKRGKSSNIWSLENDKQGREILLHYLYGGGGDLNYTDGEWGDYMKKNEVLKLKVSEVVLPMADNINPGSSISVDEVYSMEIENGEDIVGYQYLHGTNAEAGGFQIKGEISKKSDGTVIYDLTYTWNDIMDPNFMYDSDSKKAMLAKILSLGQAADYEMHITWSDKTIISGDKTEGWLADIENISECP